MKPEKPSNTCPECGSPRKFWHCYTRCPTPTHVVTCLNCKVVYLTGQKPPR